jgi:hypothetical protein
MSRQRFLVFLATVSGAALGIGVAARALARDAFGSAERAPPRPRWEGRRVPVEPIDPSIEAPAGAPSAAAQQAQHPPALPPQPTSPSTESPYDSCRRSFYERGIPYDFFACEPPK